MLQEGGGEWIEDATRFWFFYQDFSYWVYLVRIIELWKQQLQKQQWAAFFRIFRHCPAFFGHLVIHFSIEISLVRPIFFVLKSCKDSDQPGHPSSLTRVFTVRMKKPWVFSYPLSGQRILWSDWADVHADMGIRWAHMPFCWFCHALAH